MSKEAILGSSVACMAICRPASGLKGEPLSSGFSTDESLISAFAVPHCGENMGRRICSNLFKKGQSTARLVISKPVNNGRLFIHKVLLPALFAVTVQKCDVVLRYCVIDILGGRGAGGCTLIVGGRLGGRMRKDRRAKQEYPEKTLGNKSVRSFDQNTLQHFFFQRLAVYQLSCACQMFVLLIKGADSRPQERKIMTVVQWSVLAKIADLRNRLRSFLLSKRHF